jgi:hypothetical protein
VKSKRHVVAVGDLDATETVGPMTSNERCRASPGALAAGTATGLTETATAAVKDAYVGLKKVVAARFPGKPEMEIVLAQHEAKPEVWQAPLAEALVESGASTDPMVV